MQMDNEMRREERKDKANEETVWFKGISVLLLREVTIEKHFGQGRMGRQATLMITKERKTRKKFFSYLFQSFPPIIMISFPPLNTTSSCTPIFYLVRLWRFTNIECQQKTQPQYPTARTHGFLPFTQSHYNQQQDEHVFLSFVVFSSLFN